LTGLIAIDESGDTGLRGSKHFVMVAMITRRSRCLLSSYKAIPKHQTEIKFYNANRQERLKVLSEVAESDVTIVYVCIIKDRNHDASFLSGNELYEYALNELLKKALENAPCNDVNVIVDDSRFIRIDDLRKNVIGLSKETRRNVKKVEKASSNKCVRIADYVAGSIFAKYERNDDEYYKEIEEKISIACESLRPR